MEKEQIIWNVLKGRHDCSLRELEETTGMGLADLLTIVGKLAVEDKVRLSVSVNAEQGHTHLSRSEYLFARFMKLLAAHFTEERKVSFYASQMCISTKYLSTAVKQASGKSPTAWIKGKMMEEIKYRLCCTQDSIKEIAYGLNFPNLSFFGKYFKSDTGISPSLYRTICSVRGLNTSNI